MQEEMVFETVAEIWPETYYMLRINQNNYSCAWCRGKADPQLVQRLHFSGTERD